MLKYPKYSNLTTHNNLIINKKGDNFDVYLPFEVVHPQGFT